MAKVRTDSQELVSSSKKAKQQVSSTRGLNINLKTFLVFVSKIIVYTIVLSAFFLVSISLPDIASGWRIYWVLLFSNFVIGIGLLLLWVKQGYLKIYWGRFAVIMTSLFLILFVKYGLDHIALPANLYDRLALAQLPLESLFLTALMGFGILLLFLNYFKGDFEKLLQYFQSVVIGMLVINSVLIAYAIRFRDQIVSNGGLFHYLLKGILLSINNTHVLQSILIIGFGGAAISTIIYTVFASYWFIKAITEDSRKLRNLSAIMTLVWGVLALIASLASVDTFFMWLFVLVLLGWVLIAKLERFKSLNKLMKLAIDVVLAIAIVFIGIIFLALSNIKVITIIKQYILAQKINILNVVQWFKLTRGFNVLATGLHFYSNFWKLLFVGFPFNTALQVIRSSQLIGITLQATPFLIYMFEFGLLGLVLILATVYLIWRLIKIIDQDTLILIILIPVMLYPLFFVPNIIGWFIFFASVGFVLAIVYRADIITLGLYKLGSGNRKASPVLVGLISISTALGVFVLYRLYRAYSLYHSLVRKQLQVVKELDGLTSGYVKLLSKKDKKLDTALRLENKQEKGQALKQLDVKQISQLRNDLRDYSYYSYWFDKATLGAQSGHIVDFGIYKRLELLGNKYPEFYSYILGAPNTDALNNYVSEIYVLQRNVSLPVVYKLLGGAWQDLAKLQQSALYANRAMVDYDKYLWFQPLDYEVLNQYILYLLQQYKVKSSSIKNKNIANDKNIKISKQNLNSIKLKLSILLQLFSRSANGLYFQTGSLSPILTATAYRAQFYKLLGDTDNARKVFDSLINYVKASNFKDNQKSELLKVINQVKTSVLNGNASTNK